MTKEEAIIDLLANFAYIDNNIADEEVDKIKKIAKRWNINLNIDDKIKYVIENANTDEIDIYAKSIAYLNSTLSKEEKIQVLKDCAEVITADGKIFSNELIKLQLLAANWDLKLNQIL